MMNEKQGFLTCLIYTSASSLAQATLPSVLMKRDKERRGRSGAEGGGGLNAPSQGVENLVRPAAALDHSDLRQPTQHMPMAASGEELGRTRLSFSRPRSDSWLSWFLMPPRLPLSPCLSSILRAAYRLGRRDAS